MRKMKKNQTKLLTFRFILLLPLIVSIFGCNSSSDKTKKTESPISNKSEEEVEINLCFFSTETVSKLPGLNLTIPYPCDWTNENGENENVIRKFRKANLDGSMIEEMIVISDMEMELTDAESNQLLSEKYLKEGMNYNKDKNISIQRLLINDKPSAKIVYETTLENQISTISAKIVQYIIIYKSYFIRIQFGTYSKTSEHSNNLFIANQHLFEEVITNLKF
jgi:hypothetical protein